MEKKVKFVGFITKFWGKKENPKNSMLGAHS
jgi:hypothetical protein